MDVPANKLVQQQDVDDAAPSARYAEVDTALEFLTHSWVDERDVGARPLDDALVCQTVSRLRQLLAEEHTVRAQLFVVHVSRFASLMAAGLELCMTDGREGVCMTILELLSGLSFNELCAVLEACDALVLWPCVQLLMLSTTSRRLKDAVALCISRMTMSRDPKNKRAAQHWQISALSAASLVALELGGASNWADESSTAGINDGALVLLVELVEAGHREPCEAACTMLTHLANVTNPLKRISNCQQIAEFQDGIILGALLARLQELLTQPSAPPLLEGQTDYVCMLLESLRNMGQGHTSLQTALVKKGAFFYLCVILQEGLEAQAHAALLAINALTPASNQATLRTLLGITDAECVLQQYLDSDRANDADEAIGLALLGRLKATAAATRATVTGSPQAANTAPPGIRAPKSRGLFANLPAGMDGSSARSPRAPVSDVPQLVPFYRNQLHPEVLPGSIAHKHGHQLEPQQNTDRLGWALKVAAVGVCSTLLAKCLHKALPVVMRALLRR